jgi:hypothetical protein
MNFRKARAEAEGELPTLIQLPSPGVARGQGVACDPITVTVPLSVPAATKPAISESELAPLNAIAPNGNSNGSHAVSRLS